MFDFSAFTIDATFWQGLGGVFFVWLMAKITRQQVVTLLAAVVAVLLTNSPAACYVVGVLALVLKFFDIPEI